MVISRNPSMWFAIKKHLFEKGIGIEKVLHMCSQKKRVYRNIYRLFSILHGSQSKEFVRLNSGEMAGVSVATRQEKTTLGFLCVTYSLCVRHPPTDSTCILIQWHFSQSSINSIFQYLNVNLPIETYLGPNLMAQRTK